MDISKKVKDIQKQKSVLTSLEKNIKLYIKTEKTSIDKIHQAQKILMNIKKNLENTKDKDLIIEIQSFIEEETHKNKENELQLQRVFGNELHSALQKNELQLDGRLPKIKVGYYGLEFSFPKNECKISYGVNEELVGTEELNPEKIVKKIIDFEKKLENSKLDSSILLKAYDKVIATQKRELVKRAPIIKLLNQIVMDKQSTTFSINPTNKNFKEYTRIQFSHDLYKLRRDKIIHLSLITANRGQVRNKLDYLWVPNSPNNGSVYSSIEIMEEK